MGLDGRSMSRGDRRARLQYVIDGLGGPCECEKETENQSVKRSKRTTRRPTLIVKAKRLLNKFSN